MNITKLLIHLLEGLYIFCLIGLAVYGLNNLVTTLLYLNTRKRSSRLAPENYAFPKVTIQLPIFNERYTVERLLAAAARLDYPRSCLQIQVLDDSTDDTSILVQKLVEQHRNQGIPIELIHRSDRKGFKAGALNEGIKTATGDLIAIFDADFIPQPDWLRRTVSEFEDPKLGCLQTRWGHVNNHYNLFTRAQALGIDGHFVIEQTARSHNGLFLNFNGTAGLWRRICIQDAGGWQSDTLTEDLDLSYRAQMKGWRFGYLPDVVVPAELPALIEAFKRQQFRWAKGSFQTVKKLLPVFLRDQKLPWYVRLMGLIHITGYLVHPLMMLSMLLYLPVGLLAPHILKLFPWTVFAAFGPPLMYICAQSESEPRLFDRIKLIPILILIGFGLSLNNTLAVFQGLFGSKGGVFVRTPKFNLTNDGKSLGSNSYTLSISPTIWGELALTLYSLLTIFLLTPKLGWGIVPWVLVYTSGYGYMASLNLLQIMQLQVRPATARAS